MDQHENESERDDLSTNYQKEQHELAMKANDAFVLAMAKAVKSGREKVKLGTFKDSSPPIHARRFQPELHNSACGSPSAMCLESAVQQAGAVTMK